MKKAVSLVLSSGGARGLAHIGVIEELERQHFEIKSIAGCSIGAVVGGIYAAGRLKEFKKWVTKLSKIDVYRLMDLTFSTQGFIKGNKVFKELARFITDINIEELPIPFSAVAVDIHAQEEHIFEKGSLMDAIRASVAIPSIIEPYKIEDKEFIDGGVLNSIPLDLAKRNHNDLLVAVNINAMIPYMKPLKLIRNKEKQEQNSILKRLEFNDWWEKFFSKEKSKEKYSSIALLNLSYDMMQNRISEISIDKYQPDILVNVSRYAYSTFDYYKAKEIIKLGKHRFNQALEDYDCNMIEKIKLRRKRKWLKLGS